MMNFLCGYEPSVFLAHLAKWMLTDVSVTDSLPGTPVLFVDVGRAFIFVVLSAGNGNMAFTVLPIRKVGAAGVGTRSFGFAWHRFTSFGA
jgi:hypothetical protein